MLLFEVRLKDGRTENVLLLFRLKYDGKKVMCDLTHHSILEIIKVFSFSLVYMEDHNSLISFLIPMEYNKSIHVGRSSFVKIKSYSNRYGKMKMFVV